MPKPVSALDYLAEPVKHAPSPICVVFGDDRYLRRRATAQLLDTLLGDQEDRDLLCLRLEGDNAELRDVKDELATVSLFGDGGRVVIVEDGDKFVQNFRPELEDYVAKPLNSGTLILEVTTWPKNTRLFKALESSGLQIECKTPSEAKLLRWMADHAKSFHGCTLESAAAEVLLQMVGPEMGLLDQELAKLALAADEGQSISPELVKKMTGAWRAKTTWVMLDAALDGRPADALNQLDLLLRSGEHPIAILGQISASLRRFAEATRNFRLSYAQGRRISLKQALEQAGIKPFILAKSEARLKRMGRHRGARLYRWLADADLAMKGHHSAPPLARLELERLLVRISSSELREPAEISA